MANDRHLDILQQGVEVWNRWRLKNSNTIVNLEGASLVEADLKGADLDRVYLSEADLSKANLSGASLDGADLENANFEGACLREASFDGANLREAYLLEANLTKGYFSYTNLTGAYLSNTNWSYATCAYTVFGDVDLSTAKALDTVYHTAPSTIGIDTIYRSNGKIPETFLRGAGVPDNFIAYMHSLTTDAFDFYSCFISYSSKDQAFVERLYADLQSKGVRCWYAPKDLKTGDRHRQTIFDQIRLHEKLLVVLSEHSIASDWVEDEVNKAIEEERRHDKQMLFPIRLDNVIMETEESWAAKIRHQRHITDLTGWKNHDTYLQSFDRLMRDLKVEKRP